jgi:hypothetical protein
MKLNEIIELNGKEYTVELNRESILRIEQYTNLKQSSDKINSASLEDKSNKEIAENENPFAEEINEDKLENDAKEKQEQIKKVMSRAFWIWLYPNEKLSIKQVEEILEPYYQDESKAKELTDMYLDLTDKSVEIREKYLEERKNLKALAK